MKKLFLSLLTLVMALPMLATETTKVLYEQEWTCTGGWEGFVTIAKSDLVGLAADDKIQVNVTAISSDSEWPCVYIQYVDASDKWLDFTDAHQINLTVGQSVPYTAEFTLTTDMVDKILAGKYLVVKGCGYTGNKITWIHNDPLPEGTLWQGTQEMPAAWGKYITIAAEKFADAKAGYTLRCMAANVGSGAQVQIGNPSPWAQTQLKSFGGKYCDFTLTEDEVTSFKAGGCFVSGCSYILTEVKMFDPSAEVKYTTTLNITQPDWTWTDSKPVIGLNITNSGAASATVPVEIDVTTDKSETVATYKQDVTLEGLETKAVDITLSDIENPGIYRFTAYVNDEQVSYTRPEDKAYTWTTMNIAYKPTEISSPADAQSDFKAYWDGVKAQLKAIPMDAQLELVKEGTYRNLYKVTLNSVPNGTSGDPVQIRGYYAEVKAEGTYPTVINFQGYDSGGTGDLWIPGADDQQDYNTLVISARGQSYGNRDPYKADNIYCNPTDEDIKDFNIKQGWWFTYCFGDTAKYYYKGAYMDQVRGIDFVCSRAKVDKANIFCTGGSQGGAFTLVAAALSDGRVNAIAPAIQFMGDFPDYFQVGNWPVSEAKSAAAMQGMSEEEMYKFLSYYDTKNFASMITAPTLSSIGLQDNVCPAHTNLAPYNLLTCEKVLYINKNLVHEVPNNNTWSTPNNSDRDWSALQNAWWASHLKTTGISTIKNEELRMKNSKVFNLAGQKVSNDTTGLVIVDGNKVIK